MKYKLFYKELEVGEIVQLAEDFPSLSGRYQLNPNLEKENHLISEYVKYSIQVGILIESNDDEWEDFMLKEEFKFNELIESDHWELLGSNEKKHSILIPSFFTKNEIVWRWNFWIE